MTDEITPKPKSKRGFASMDKAKALEIQRKGGLSVPPEKRTFSTDPTLARDAGIAGGKASKGSKL